MVSAPVKPLICPARPDALPSMVQPAPSSNWMDPKLVIVVPRPAANSRTLTVAAPAVLPPSIVPWIRERGSMTRRLANQPKNLIAV
jgi:hypothetical protein